MHIYKENFDWMLMTLPRILQHTDTTRTFTNKNGILFTVCCQQDEKKAIWWNGNAVSYMYLSLLHRTNATFTYINLILVGCTYRICGIQNLQHDNYSTNSLIYTNTPDWLYWSKRIYKRTANQNLILHAVNCKIIC